MLPSIPRPAGLVTAVVAIALVAGAAPRAESRPSVLLVTVDALRSDRMSGYGYERGTTPNLDRLLSRGATFTAARTVEPLTSPAICSMLTGLEPHEHGSSRNGLRVRPGVNSLPAELGRAGYRTAAFVSNWTLRDKLSGLGEHFDHWEEVLTRRRWFGMVTREADADDVNSAALEWLDAQLAAEPARPVLLWVHYVEPHAPYRLHRRHLQALGLPERGSYSASERYDTEVAEVDRAIGELLAAFSDRGLLDRSLLVFTADHGESLGENNYWGHGRWLYEPGLRVPLGIVWPARIAPRTVRAPAMTVDVARTVLGLVDRDTAKLSGPGFDWSEVLLHGAAEPPDRATFFQAHRSAVMSDHESDRARRSGLIEVAVLRGQRKEILRVESGKHRTFDLSTDPVESLDLTPSKSTASEELIDWLRRVYSGLNHPDDEPVEPLDAESVKALQSLGYVD